MFGEGLGSVHTLNCTQPPGTDNYNNSDYHWIPTTTCTHDNDIGVRCQAYEDVDLCAVKQKDVCTPSMTVTHDRASDNHETHSTSSTLNESLDEATTSVADSLTVDSILNTTEVLAVLTGLLAAALVVVTMGWIVLCVYLRKRLKQR